MTRHKQIELLLYISEGHNTFAEISTKFPDISSAELDYYSTCRIPEEHILIAPYGYSSYKSDGFSPEDIFGITDQGYDLLDEARQEAKIISLNQKANDLAQKSYLSSLRSEKYSKIAIIIAAISLALSLVQPLKLLVSNLQL